MSESWGALLSFSSFVLLSMKQAYLWLRTSSNIKTSGAYILFKERCFPYTVRPLRSEFSLWKLAQLESWPFRTLFSHIDRYGHPFRREAQSRYSVPNASIPIQKAQLTLMWPFLTFASTCSISLVKKAILVYPLSSLYNQVVFLFFFLKTYSWYKHIFIFISCQVRTPQSCKLNAPKATSSRLK